MTQNGKKKRLGNFYLSLFKRSAHSAVPFTGRWWLDGFQKRSNIVKIFKFTFFS